MKKEIINILNKQRKYFKDNNTFSYNVRKAYLKKMYLYIKEHEDEITEALYLDLGKSKTESYMAEIGMVLNEIGHLIKHLRKYMKPKRCKTPLAQYVSKSFQLPMPYGNVLIMSPWNYPFLLSIDPLCEALAAGNTVILKTSEYSKNTSNVIKKLVDDIFPNELVYVVFGGYEENQILLEQKFDYIFFTGSKGVGKIVYETAARTLTPVTLELGGKSPCIIDEKCNVKLAAKRIAWGKFLNLGQTCVSPDYVFCNEKVYDKFVLCLQNEIIKQYGENPLSNPNYGKIINQRHFARLLGYFDESNILFGGKYDEDKLKIEPTLLKNIDYNHRIMKEEIFGPILPIIKYSSLIDVVEYINSNETPLALYIFSKNRHNINYVTNYSAFGGGCVNDVVIHLATTNMSFGGFKESGIGSYHGKKGFDTFSHYKSIVDKKTWIDLPMRYQPYNSFFDRLIHFFMK
ncbi:MAG: aldehyde dehydrogenase [Anaeroplasma sp.]|nr:aldehyde dehydrogenase [Anaeroplasma sp.]